MKATELENHGEKGSGRAQERTCSKEYLLQKKKREKKKKKKEHRKWRESS